MKFSDLTERQASALASFYLLAVQTKVQEEENLAQAGMRLLVIGNGAGVALLASFLASDPGRALAGALVSPVLLFLVGATLATLIYIPLIGVANRASAHSGESVIKVLRDEMDIEEFQHYGFNRLGRVVVLSLLLLSIGCFVLGALLSILALSAASTQESAR